MASKLWAGVALKLILNSRIFKTERHKENLFLRASQRVAAGPHIFAAAILLFKQLFGWIVRYLNSCRRINFFLTALHF